jgi:hypothetical protein
MTPCGRQSTVWRLRAVQGWLPAGRRVVGAGQDPGHIIQNQSHFCPILCQSALPSFHFFRAAPGFPLLHLRSVFRWSPRILTLLDHGRMARGGHGLPKVSLGPPCPTPRALQSGPKRTRSVHVACTPFFGTSDDDTKFSHYLSVT